MLDQMSGGRFQLGVGRGVSPFETQCYGLDFSKTAKSITRRSNSFAKVSVRTS
jgi:alkanesulfonate monooxygenase SsuD/methylene tetrahydromethanopterin reductase-like flavin-dependent oxidoreductase (luciferase family)